ncbi:hypothetical protein ACZ11_23810 [Lysinibacillus xylanilyticus]|uniref:PRTase-CE domain-containing protein n=1 Tax=Lysinibacillus xylanilyticus TaxID=582475 RepID=A0A0K9F109_9BACI|nr:phosphoribosyltransferase [Lysinibacillus xylanilyticus]KMY28264.1 hypothetical protein ACZ11_23810 [Lysinibacillus xylanilyticus]
MMMGDLMKYKKKQESISASTFAKLTAIFLSKSWEIDDGDNDFSLFNRFCTALSMLSEEEQILVLELTENFTKVEANDYLVYLSQALKRFIETNRTKLVSIKNIFIAPLLAPKDFGKSKSSTAVQYFIRSIVHTYPDIAGKNISFTEGLEVSDSLINREDSILLLVDDFVGSGGTALEAIEYLEQKKNIKKSKISLITIATLEKGERVLNENNISIFYAMKFKRGITDYYDSTVLPEKISIMESIEKKVKAHKNEEFGYDSSEALITLIRTPNNTFPVFWKQKKGRVAPFPR